MVTAAVNPPTGSPFAALFGSMRGLVDAGGRERSAATSLGGAAAGAQPTRDETASREGFWERLAGTRAFARSTPPAAEPALDMESLKREMREALAWARENRGKWRGLDVNSIAPPATAEPAFPTPAAEVSAAGVEARHSGPPGDIRHRKGVPIRGASDVDDPRGNPASTPPRPRDWAPPDPGCSRPGDGGSGDIESRPASWMSPSPSGWPWATRPLSISLDDSANQAPPKEGIPDGSS